MDKKFQSECSTVGIHAVDPNMNGYEALIQQRHVRLLGRSVDLNHLICQRVNAALIGSIDIAISIFESGNLTDIVVRRFVFQLHVVSALGLMNPI